ncbi:hypothetical protein AK830_g8430 [Neonectria ditissima]|uniref:Uncharacterized protein n=1 Tax=Neonectria ditissima TaxID=78410 RepID=A0A0P7AKH4_9HYPO|nr:hypothetical protein AK830_g8430 [Neonectria ditissima]
MDAEPKDDGSSESQAPSNTPQPPQDEQESQLHPKGTPENNPPAAPHDAPDAFATPPQLASTQQLRTPLPPSRPRHEGWMGTGIPMAKCDFCDHRSQGTLQRCSVCKIAICRECLDAGRLDSRHHLDADSVRWDLHVAAAQPTAEKKLKKTRAATAKTGSTRARGAGRSRARGARTARNVATRASAAAPQAVSPVPTIASYDESTVDVGEGPEQEDQLGLMEEDQPTEAQQLHDQLLPEPPRLPLQFPPGQPAFIEPPVEVGRRPHPPPAQSSYWPGQRHLHSRPILPAPRPDCPRPSPYQPAPVAFPPPAPPSLSGDSYEGRQGSAFSDERSCRYHPYSRTVTPRPALQYDDGVSGQGRQVGDQGTYTQPRLPPLHQVEPGAVEGLPRENQREMYSIDASLPPIRDLGFSSPASRAPVNGHVHPPQQQHFQQQQHPQQQQHHQQQYSQQQQHYGNQQQHYGNQQQHYDQQQHYRNQQHYSHQQHYSQQQQQQRYNHAHLQTRPLPNVLVQRLGKQLETDARATSKECSDWPIDHCLRYELGRAWSRRAAQTSLFSAILDPAGVEDVDFSFRIICAGADIASINLQLATRNAVRDWLVEMQRHLCDSGLMLYMRVAQLN